MKKYITPYSAIIKLQSTENIAGASGGSQQYINPTASKINCTQGDVDCYEVVITFNGYKFSQINQDTLESEMVRYLDKAHALDDQKNVLSSLGVDPYDMVYELIIYVGDLC